MNPPEPVELRSGPDGLLEAGRGERLIAELVEQASPTGTSVTLVRRQAPIDPAELRDLLDAVTARAASNGGNGLELVTSDPLVRDVARRHGFTGSLRGPLAPGPTGVPSWTDDPAGVRDAVQQLLPGIAVGVEADAGAARAFLRRAVSGVSKTFNLLAAPDDVAPPTRFSVPRRSDLLVESVAALHRHDDRDPSPLRPRRRHRPPHLLRPTRTSSCSTDSTQGSADRSIGLIHMNASFASLEGLTMMEQLRAARSGGGSAGVPAPFNQIDGTTAHEIWHQMEGAIEARRSMDGIDLRRRLGEALGVETLEQAVNGMRPRSPDAWKAAHARLVDEVSPYGATAPLEATAEMFKLWWCANGEPTPIIRRFGELAEPLLDRFDT